MMIHILKKRLQNTSTNDMVKNNLASERVEETSAAGVLRIIAERLMEFINKLCLLNLLGESI